MKLSLILSRAFQWVVRRLDPTLPLKLRKAKRKLSEGNMPTTNVEVHLTGPQFRFGTIHPAVVDVSETGDLVAFKPCMVDEWDKPGTFPAIILTISENELPPEWQYLAIDGWTLSITNACNSNILTQQIHVLNYGDKYILLNPRLAFISDEIVGPIRQAFATYSDEDIIASANVAHPFRLTIGPPKDGPAQEKISLRGIGTIRRRHLDAASYLARFTTNSYSYSYSYTTRLAQGQRARTQTWTYTTDR